MGFKDQLAQAGVEPPAQAAAAPAADETAPEKSAAGPTPGRYAGVKGWADRDPNLTASGLFEVLETKEHTGELGVYFHITLRVIESTDPLRHPPLSRCKISQNVTPFTKAGKTGQQKVLGFCRAMAEYNSDAEFMSKVPRWVDLIDAANGCEKLADGTPNPFGKNPFAGQIVRVISEPAFDKQGKPVLSTKDGSQFHNYAMSTAQAPAKAGEG